MRDMPLLVPKRVLFLLPLLDRTLHVFVEASPSMKAASQTYTAADGLLLPYLRSATSSPSCD